MHYYNNWEVCGPIIVLVHALLQSSFLYRKLVAVHNPVVFRANLVRTPITESAQSRHGTQIAFVARLQLFPIRATVCTQK